MFRGSGRIPDAKKTHFSTPIYQSGPTSYPHRLSFYSIPPTSEITLDQFEQWAIDRLRILGEIESCQYRNKTPKETEAILKPLLEKYLPLSSSSSSENLAKVTDERKKDHYSHFILRLAFSRSDELRNRFSRAERTLFRLRWASDDASERQRFVSSLNFDWDSVTEDELRVFGRQLAATTGGSVKAERESFFKVDWERVPDLIEQRRVFLRAGKAFVPISEQLSLVLDEFSTRLDAALEVTARALPRLDEDDRLVPILNHLSLGFTQPEYSTIENFSGAVITAKSIDTLAHPHFPLCMSHLHDTFKRTHHLKHFGRLQYTLFLKGIGLSCDEAIMFWRTNFNITDDKFNKEYRYNIRHTYGLEGNRRNYTPFSCHQILTDRHPGPGETHGCPYRHFGEEPLVIALNREGIVDREVLNGVREDVSKQKYHVACNRVFEYVHAKELKKAKDEGRPGLDETIVHPNTYFARSWELKNPGASTGRMQGTAAADQTGEMED